jgi:hypothetical protein
VVTTSHYFIPNFSSDTLLMYVTNPKVYSAIMFVLVIVKVGVIKEDKISRLGCRQG